MEEKFYQHLFSKKYNFTLTATCSGAFFSHVCRFDNIWCLATGKGTNGRLIQHAEVIVEFRELLVSQNIIAQFVHLLRTDKNSLLSYISETEHMIGQILKDVVETVPTIRKKDGAEQSWSQTSNAAQRRVEGMQREQNPQKRSLRRATRK